MDPLHRFERMAALSEDMANAARRNDWDLLGTLERQLAEEREAQRRLEPEGTQAAGQTDAQLRRKAELITRILANTDEVRTHVDPFLESTRKLLSGAVRDHNVRKAYGAFGP